MQLALGSEEDWARLEALAASKQTLLKKLDEYEGALQAEDAAANAASKARVAGWIGEVTVEEQAAILKGDMRPSVPISLEEAKQQYGERWAIFTPVEKAAILKGTTAQAAMRRRTSSAQYASFSQRPRAGGTL